jgi:putative oxidoreductase
MTTSFSSSPVVDAAPLVTLPRRRRAATIALWTVQLAVAALILMAGTFKLVGDPQMVALFQAIGLGQWFRYLTGAIEVVAGLTLVIPTLAAFGALLLVPTMIGAVATHLFIVGGSPLLPLALLVAAVTIVSARRRELAPIVAVLR